MAPELVLRSMSLSIESQLQSIILSSTSVIGDVPQSD